MATTVKPPTVERVATSRRSNRWLVVAVVVLALAVLALGAWMIYDLVAEPETAAPDAVRELMDDYTAAWNNYDGDAFMALTTDFYTFDNGFETLARSSTASSVRGGIWKAAGMQVERVGEYITIGDGPYYVAAVNRIESNDPVDFFGISTNVVVETEDGLKVAEHRFLGDAFTGNN